MSYTPRLKTKYSEEIAGKLKEQFEFKSVMRIPKLKKIVLSQGVGDAISDKKLVDSAVNDMTIIAGQKAVSTLSKKDISNFKLRKGMPVGVKITLRGDKMYEFLDRLINIALPDKGFDGTGNFNMGIKEHIIFPEIDIDKVNKIFGMDITFVTSTSSDEEGKALMKEFGFPFVKN